MENTETVEVHKKGNGFEIIVQHDQTGSGYGMDLSKDAYEQLRLHFVSGSFFDIIEGNVKMQMEVENFVRKRIYRFLLNEYDLKLTFKEWVFLNYR